jgi:hypothetical protein
MSLDIQRVKRYVFALSCGRCCLSVNTMKTAAEQKYTTFENHPGRAVVQCYFDLMLLYSVKYAFSICNFVGIQVVSVRPLILLSTISLTKKRVE